jgi:rhodanese-related sulfurtransferase
MTTPDQIAQVDPTQAAKLAADGALLLDVREPGEWAAGHAANAVHIPLGDLRVDVVTRDRLVIAVCRSGNRSGKAAVALTDIGVDVRNMAGGMKAWAAAGLPIVRDDGAPGTVA